MHPLPLIRRAGPAGGLALAALLGAAGCAPDSLLPEPEAAPSAWTLVNPRPFDVHITDMWGTAPDRMFAVGLYGGLLVREGAVWRRAPSPTASPFWDIHGCDWNHVWAVSEEGLLFFDGFRWRREGPADLDQNVRVFCNGPDDVMLVTADSLSFHFDGTTWRQQQLPVRPTSTPGDWLAGAPDGRYLAVGRDGVCARWEQGRWSVVPTDLERTYHAARFAPDGGDGRWYVAVEFWDDQAVRLYRLVGDRLFSEGRFEGGLFVGLELGADPDAPYVLTSLWGSDVVRIRSGTMGDLQVAGSPTGKLAVFPGRDDPHNDDFVFGAPYGALREGCRQPARLEPLTSSVPVSPRGFMVWPNGDFAAWQDHRILHGRQGALTTEDVAVPWEFHGLWGPAPGDLLVCADAGLVLRLRDGEDPTGAFVGTGRDLLAIWGRDADDVWTGGWDATAHWDGQDWTVFPWPLAGALTELRGGPAGFYAMSDQALGHWDGTAWVAAGPPGATQYHSLDVDPADGEPVVVARLDDGGPRRVLRLRDGAWEDLGSPGDRARGVLALAGGEVRVMTDQGWFVRSGPDWSEAALPVDSWDAYFFGRIAGGVEGGLFAAFSTGGLYHLDLQGVGPWH